jgi:glycosyltransferase involved in cell wall biosynthesis
MPSIFESYGIAVAEAMSYGKAIVATDVGGLPEVVRDGGLLCKPKDPGDIANKILILMQDDRLRREKAKRAQFLAMSYTWDALSPLIEMNYLDVMQ